MKLTLRQRNYRPFSVLFQRKNSHVYHLPEDPTTAQDKIYRILDETAPSQNPEEFFNGFADALHALSRGLKEGRPTSFYCGSVCLTLE